MPETPCHIINHTSFAVTMGREVDAFKAQAQLEDFFHQRLTPALDQALSDFAADADCQIERLVIDLGAIDIHHPDRRITDKIRAAIAAALQRLEKPVVMTLRPEVRLHRSLMAFLESGQIPWDTPVDTLVALERDIQTLKPEALGPLIAEIHRLLGRSAIRRRLLIQFSGSFVRWLLEKLQPALPAAFASAVPHRHPTPVPSEQLALQLEAAVQVPPGSALKDLTQVLRARLRASEPDTQGAAAATEAPMDTDADTAAAEKVNAAVEARDQAVFAFQAGVVLLHPFLTRFFDRCGLLTDALRFHHRRDRELGVHLLHFLTTGQEQPEEPQTTVYKVLCGLDIHEPVIKALELAEVHRHEATALLHSAIAHWGRLKNTSPDGLRSAFLQRQGKLQRIDDGWHLTVEQHAIDILLDRLPWRLSVIRLPWLRQPVRVDWA